MISILKLDVFNQMGSAWKKLTKVSNAKEAKQTISIILLLIMGGHGGLNILPQKKWNVYRKDN